VHQVRRVTLQDVADQAGVSLTTASRVVNEGARRVGPGLAQRVNQAVAELGYTANLQARAVATGQSTMIGVVVHDIADPYFSSIAAGLIEAAEARQLLVCMSSTAATEVAEREYVALMRAQRARAVILIGSRTDDTAAREALCAEIAAFTSSGGRAAGFRAEPASPVAASFHSMPAPALAGSTPASGSLRTDPATPGHPVGWRE